VGGARGEVVVAPVDVALSQAVVVQPNLVLVLKKRANIVKDRLFGLPVNIVPPNTVRRGTFLSDRRP